jgi:DNA-binding transcriptional LysR family regulator
MVQRADVSVAEITSFEAVVSTGSFTKAAEFLGIAKSSVGKNIQRLEERLATRLFQRTTRAVRLTSDGETYLHATQIALRTLRDAEMKLAASKEEVAGRVRINLPASFGRLFIPSMHSLRRRYPKLTLDLTFSDRMSDPVAEGWDIVVRIGELSVTSDMVVRKLCDTRFGLYASPGYVAERGPLNSVADLHAHDAILFRGSSGRLNPWSVDDGGYIRQLTPEAAIILEDGQALIDMLASGLGISQLLDHIADPHVKAGRLVHVLPPADVDGPPVHALIPSGHKMASRTRAVLTHLADDFRQGSNS